MTQENLVKVLQLLKDADIGDYKAIETFCFNRRLNLQQAKDNTIKEIAETLKA